MSPWGAELTTLLRKHPFRRRVLVLDMDGADSTAAEILLGNGNGSCQLVGVCRFGQEALTETATVTEIARQHNATTLALRPGPKVDTGLLRALIECVERGIEVVPMSALLEETTGRIPFEYPHEMGNAPLLVQPSPLSVFRRVWKRMIDVVLATFGLWCFGLVLPFVALAIYIDSPGPIFYTQERVGKGGRVFRIYKLRTMVADENDKASWPEENHARVTGVGRILRASHLDEFPQFLNVLKGEMSLVGPRPERPELIEQLAADVPLYRLRHAVMPGMGGWGLIKQGYAKSRQDMLTRLEYDLYYIKHQSFWLDLVIMVKTIGHALAFKGR